MKTNSSNLTILLIVQNEEKRIARALQSALWAKRIVVIDGGSSDRTCEIAESLGAEIHHRPFDDFHRQRTFALSKIETEWVFGLDADEVVSSELAEAVTRIAAQQSPEFSGYKVLRHNYFWGTRLQHLSKNDWQLRLCRTSSVQVTNTPVHEGYVTPPPVGRIQQGFLEHHTYENIQQFIRKVNLYTTLSAPAVAKRKTNIRVSDFFTHPLSALWKHLIAHRGYRDGRAGIALSLLNAVCNLLEYMKAYEYQKGLSHVLE